MAWTCRPSLRGLEPIAEFRLLFLTVPLSVLWLIAAMVGIIEIQQFLVIAIFQVIALSILGRRVYRILLGPFLFLFFLVPSGQILVPWLQNFTAHFVVFGLRLTGIPVFGDGVTIEIPEGTFMVAEACAGLRFLVASVAFGVFFSWLVYRGLSRRLLFIALSIVVPIIANGLRCYGILILAHLMGSAKAVIADHIIYGWGFFSAVTIVLIVIGLAFADRPQLGDRNAVPPSASRARPSAVPIRSVMLVAVLGLIGAAVGPAYAGLKSGQPESASLATAAAPTVMPPWHDASAVEPSWQPLIIAPTRAFLEHFADGAERVTRYVALYRRRMLRDDLVRGDNRIEDEHRWQRLGSGETSVIIHGQKWHVATTELGRGVWHILVWHFYVVNGRIVAGATAAKLMEARSTFLGGQPISAFYAIAATEDDPDHPARQTLTRFLGAMEPPTAYLKALAAGR
jgi:EpsI family protein